MKGKRKYFTLIEVLIVVAIIIILISLIQPAFKEVRENAYRVACINNIRNLAYGWGMYNSDHNGKVMKAISYQDVADGSEPWVTTTIPSDPLDIQQENVKKGALYEYINNYEPYGCLNREENEVRTYSSNHVLNGLNNFVLGRGVTVIKNESQLTGRRMLYIDDWKDQDDAAWAIYRNYSSWWNTAPRRHRQGVCLGYTDGSAEFYSFEDPRSNYAHDLDFWGQGNYMVQLDNEDIRYLAKAVFGPENVAW